MYCTNDILRNRQHDDMMIEPPPSPPPSSSSPRSNNNKEEQLMIMTDAASGTAEFLPTGFELCKHGHTCPSCNSQLILKVPTSTNTNDSSSNKSNKTTPKITNGMQKMFASTALNDDELAVLLHNDLDDDDDDDEDDDYDTSDATPRKVQSSLQSAHSANLLLQALSFDASTRYNDTKRGLDICNVTEGVSYCYECRVHVITCAEELERLFDDDDDDENDDGNSMEWLRGSLLVAVDNAEDLAYQSRRQRQQQKNKKKQLQSRTVPSIKEQDTGLSDIMELDYPYNETGGKHPPQYNEAKTKKNVLQLPTRPSEFDYDYRHRVATKTMATRIIRGYTLVEEICDECEMPLMKKADDDEVGDAGGKDAGFFPNMPECVVCPKLKKKISKYHSNNAHNNKKNVNTDDEEAAEHSYEVVDPISAIIENARSEAPKHPGPRPRRYVQPEIAEAKQFVMQRQIMNPMSINAVNNVKRICKDGIGFNGKEECSSSSQDNDTASITDQSSTDNDQLTVDANNGGYINPGINWDELLLNGRTILSKRLNEGWVLSSTNCAGLNCKGTPLLQRATNNEELIGYLDDNTLDYCAVCGGSGNGEDGAYEREIEWQVKAAKAAERVAKEIMPDWDELAGNGRALLAERLKQGWTMSSENCLGYHCKEMPLTNIEGGPNSCVVCGGSGNGVDGAYENYKPREVVEEERALVSQELSRLVSMGWVIRESLCARCLMPLVAEEDDAEDELCILCGRIPENNPHDDDGAEVVVANAGEDVTGDSHMNENIMYETDTLKQAVIAPVQTYGNDNANAAGKRLAMGWTLPNAGLCYHCHGIQMAPPNSIEIGCINQGCPSVLAAAYTFLPEPHESTGPVRLIGRGYSKSNYGVDEEQQVEEEQAEAQLSSVRQQSQIHNNKNETTLRGRALREHHRQHLPGNNTQTIYEDDELEYEQHEYPPIGQVGLQRNGMRFYDEPSVLSNVSEGVEGDSVASSTALGMILLELDEAKYELEAIQQDGGGEDNAEECAQKQIQIAMLIERLSRTAGGME